MLAHVSSNRCKDRSGLVSKSVLGKGRINAALEVERLSLAGSAGQPGTSYGSVDQATDAGSGLLISESLIDRDDGPIEQQSLTHDTSVVPGDDTEMEQQQDRTWPRALDFGKCQPGSRSTVEGLDNLSIAGSSKSAATMGWSKALFPDAKPTPVTGDYTRPSAQPSLFRGGRKVPNDVPSPLQFLARDRLGKPIRTAWDSHIFERDLAGKYKCPFQRCK